MCTNTIVERPTTRTYPPAGPVVIASRADVIEEPDAVAVEVERLIARLGAPAA